MAFDAGSVVAKVKADITEFKEGMNNMKEAASTAMDRVKDGVDGMNNGIKGMTPTLLKVSAGVAVVGGAATLAIKGWLDEAMEGERITAQLNQTLESTGRVAEISAEEIENMAGALTAGRNITDDAVTSAATMLLKYDEISKETMPRLLATAMDVATGLNGGLTPSTEQLSATADMLGKAMENPEMGMKKLKAAGVMLDEGQVMLVEKMMATGNVAGAQEVLFNELAKAYEGQSAAQAETLAGRMEQVTNTVNKLKEDLGTALLPILTTFAEKLGVVATWFQNLSPELKQFIAIGTLVVAGLAAILVPVMGLVMALPMITAGFAALAGGLAFLLSPVTLVIAAIVALYIAWKTNFLGIQTLTQQWVDFIKMLFIGLQAVWNVIFPALLATATTVFNALSAFFTAFWMAVKLTFGTYLAILTGDWGTAFKNIKLIGEAIWNGIKDAFSGMMNGIKSAYDSVAGPLKGAWSTLWNGIGDVAAGVWTGIKAAFTAGINFIIDKVNRLVDMINSVSGMVPGGSKIKIPSIPRLAEGGIIRATPGGVLANIGEGRHDEAVIPLDGKHGIGGNTFVFPNSVISTEEGVRDLFDRALGGMQPRLN